MHPKYIFVNQSLWFFFKKASVSPDGRKMVVVGDDKKVHLFAVRPAGQYELLTTMAAAIDANFSVSWTSDSEKFAVASQDGSVTVWDVRSTEPLCKLGTIGNVSYTFSGTSIT